MDDLNAFRGLEEKTENSVILKGRFKAVETTTYGLFIIFFNESLRTVDNLMVITSHYSSLFEIDPHLPWYIIEENIINLKWKGDIAVNVTLDLQNYLESSLERDRGSELFYLIKNNDETKIETLLQAVLIKPLSDRNIIIETVSEVISKERIRSIRDDRNRSKEKTPPPKTSHYDLKGQVIIDVDLILAPVSGIPIFELAQGDKIMVRINDRTVKGNYYIDLLGTRVEGNIIPIPALVVDIKKGENRDYHILCKLKEGIYGKAIETEQVRLKMYDELLTPGLKQGQTPMEVESVKKRSFPLFIVVIGGLLFIAILFFVIMWFYNIL